MLTIVAIVGQPNSLLFRIFSTLRHRAPILVAMSHVSGSTLQQISNSLPTSSAGTISPGMTHSTVNASVSLSNGGSIDYTIELVRSGIGWKVTKRYHNT